MWTGARTERTINIVHQQNLKYAMEAGMTLDEWHKMMSKKGEEIKPVLLKKQSIQKYVPQTAVEQVLNQLFPNVHGDESDNQTDIS